MIYLIRNLISEIPHMKIIKTSEASKIRSQIANTAAKMIIESGLDYHTAKLKAAKVVLGDMMYRDNLIPDNSIVESEIRDYFSIFYDKSQSLHLKYLRRIAIEVMKMLEKFSPYLTGAVLNGTATKHSDIHIQLFVDSSKDVAIFLLNNHITFSVSESSNYFQKSKNVETISLVYKGENIHFYIYDYNDLKIKSKHSKKIVHANLAQLITIFQESKKE
tara:strand:- start:36 stop:689 length:654 start_codon:yes stop_codon:yes gene_type:complete